MSHAEHELRVIEEGKELGTKILKLTEFILTSPKFATLQEVEQELMWEQLHAMQFYWKVLNKRIALFKKPI